MPDPENVPVRIEVTDGASIPDPKDPRIITAWSISLFGAILTLVLLCFCIPDRYVPIVKKLPEGIWITFQVTVFSIIFTIPLGCMVGLGRLSRFRPLNLLVSTYVEVIRGIPLLVQLFYIYYGMSKLLNVPAKVAAVVSLTFCYGAYMGEVFRAGISAIPKGQTEAARSLGFNRVQTMWYIILPQAWRTILPPVGNECIALLKDTSLISILAVPDLLRVAREHASTSFHYFETYTVVAIFFLIITLILSKCVSIMELRLSHYDRR
ncbi:amino acid ABC transporter permease [Desulfovibrio sp. OttesenSCG-928-A18]|nr:amino acid ABC transporter permease [Desulfovibrio sp. OttesenSCG-928-A18]